ncbi:MAG: archease [Candidatus Wildermuthbacteria bacterium]|nr:archease [Candidatus Wildermuthbacteria bacterium]
METFEILEHTGDVKIKVCGKTKEELFENAMAGMFAVLNPKSEVRNPKQRTIHIQSPDINALLVDFLSEVNYLRQVHREVYDRVEFLKFSDTELEGTLAGYEAKEFGEDIKAVTFHDLNINQNEQRIWETIIVFDV